MPETVARSLTGIIARTQYHSRPGSRRIVRSNLKIVLPDGASDGEIDATAKKVFCNFGKSIYCFLRIGDSASERLRSRCDYAGIDAVTAELRGKGGFILAGPHVGPWEMGGVFLSATGLRVHTVALDHPSARVTRFFEERRRSVGIVCHPVGGAFPRLREALGAGSCVALLIDREYGRGGKSSTLFGREVVLPTGHAALAVQCGVPIVTAVCVFAPAEGFRFVFKGPYYPDPTLGEEARAEDLHRRCRRNMEEFILEHPDQWFNFSPLGGGADG